MAKAKKVKPVADPSKGGRARANVLTPDQRREIASAAANARWGDSEEPVEPSLVPSTQQAFEGGPNGFEMPYSLLPGQLTIGKVVIECHVLSNEKRVLTQREMVRVLSGGRESGNLQRYLQRNPLTATGFDMGPTIHFNVPGTGRAAFGYEATQLIEVCEKYLQAREMNLLGAKQLKLALHAEIIIRATARVGIIALIDEATGYQKIRAKNALQLKMQAFIAEDMQDWARMFPEEFWLELARLEGIRYSPRQRPLRWGKYVMMFVYDAVDPDVGKWLRQNNPDPHFLKNHHQWLKKFGRQKVHDQIMQVVVVMKMCRDIGDFKAKFAHVFKKMPLQLTFDDMEWINS